MIRLNNFKTVLLLFFISIFMFSTSNILSPKRFDQLKKTNNEVIQLLRDKDIKKLSKHIHPKKGVLFSPYSDVLTFNRVVLKKGNLVKLYNSNEVLLWGYYDGTGEQMFMTFQDYYNKFVYSLNFIEYEPNYNDIIGRGNSLENTKQLFRNSEVVEYFIQGSKGKELEWKSLRLVYELYNDKYYLVAIINNQWTI